MAWLIGCEESGAVRDALLRRGIEAVSCDLKPTRTPGPHIQGDLRDAIASRQWSGLIAFPDCTYLTNSAAWAFGDGPYHQKVKPETLVGAARRKAREEALEFVRLILGCGISRIAVENPAGSIGTMIRPANQIIQPYQFGDDASKKTCLWLVGLPKLRPTCFVEPRMVNGKPRWGNQTDSGQNRLSPHPDRARDRSVTYAGIAEAMAEQWGRFSMRAAA